MGVTDWVALSILIGMMIGVSGCSSLAHDDQELTQTWDTYVEKRVEFTNRFNNAMQEKNIPVVLAAISEFGSYTSDTYYEVVEYQVSPELEESHYWFAYHLKTQVDCCNQMGSYIRGVSGGDEAYTTHQEQYLDLMSIPCDAADRHLKKAYESLPNH